ncbi:MAG TPA: hypothetical protein VH482_34470 [Thermomicrobiales bacterium]|jgi:hypothetical protein
MRRRTFVVSGLALTILGSLGGATVHAQEATPAGSLSGAGASELHITITNTGFELSASAVPAGRVLLTVENATTGTEDTADADLVLPPDGVPLSDIEDFFVAAGSSATPAAEDQAIPSWIYTATWAGGPIVPPGKTVQALVDLTPGTWGVLNADFGVPQQPTTLTVTAATGGTQATEPTAAVGVSLQEYAFVGLDQTVPAGPQTWKVTNTGTQPHFMLLEKTPADITMDQMMTILQLPEDATPPAGFPYTESDFDFSIPGLGVLSPGQTSYVTLDLAPGRYVALCFVPDKETGAPHAMMGMVQLFTVA